MENLKITDDILSKTVNDEEVIVNLNNGTYFGLNPTGTVIWNHLKKGSQRAEILEDLKRQFKINPEQLDADIDEFVTDLKTRKMLIAE